MRESNFTVTHIHKSIQTHKYVCLWIKTSDVEKIAHYIGDDADGIIKLLRRPKKEK